MASDPQRPPSLPQGASGPDDAEAAEAAEAAESEAGTGAAEAPPAPGTGPGPARLRLGPVLALVAALTTLFGAGALRQTSPFLSVSPGPAPEITGRVTGEVADPSFGKLGKMYFTTVAVEEVSWFAYLRAQLSGDAKDLLPAPPSSPGSPDSAAAARAEMTESKRVAALVATAAVGHRPPAAGSGAKILSVQSGSAAARAGVEVGDLVTEAAGRPVTEASELVSAVRDGSGPLALRLTRGKRTVELGVELGDGERRLGVRATTHVSEAPALNVDTSGIGGSSGGLMFALAFTDALTAGDLTAGRTLAGTGTMEISGKVGPIAGVADKVRGAGRVGASVFFAPQPNAASARRAAPEGIEVVGVGSYAEALAWLCAHDGVSSACP